jgi:hypothetical protein
VLLVWTAADVSLLNSFAMSGKDLVLAWNTHATIGYTVTITSAPDPIFGRSKDITTEAIAAGAIRCYGVPQLDGWRQTDGSFYLQASNASVVFAVISLP